MIRNAGNTPLNRQPQGTVPDMSGALQDYYQAMVFTPVSKQVIGGEVVETGNPINFRGVIQPMSNRALQIKPEGQRAWTWLLLYADSTLGLGVDDVVIWNGVQTRVMALKDFSLYGYWVFELVQDWEGSGP